MHQIIVFTPLSMEGTKPILKELDHVLKVFLIYNIVLISAVQQIGHIYSLHISILFHILLHYVIIVPCAAQ